MACFDDNNNCRLWRLFPPNSIRQDHHIFGSYLGNFYRFNNSGRGCQHSQNVKKIERNRHRDPKTVHQVRCEIKSRETDRILYSP